MKRFVLKKRDMILKRKDMVWKRKDMVLKRKRMAGFANRCIKESEKFKFTSVEFQVSREQQQNNNNNNNVRETRRSL